MTTELIAKTFQGLEPLLAQELTELGANDVQIGRRMVSFTGDKEMMYRANYFLRTAIRVLKPIKHFRARSADDVYNAVKDIDWTEYIQPGMTFAVDSVVFSTEFHHSKFVAYKVKDAIADQFRERSGTRPNVSVSNPDIQLHIHISDYDATLALDSSGESLHRRGYRQESVAAPLNEVLAAAIILMTGWRGETDLLDPFCGSGTFCIEAALIARGIAPGIFRQGYAFERWPDFDEELFQKVSGDDSGEHDFLHHIYGRDIDPKAVGIARRNVRAAGLAKDITIDEADFTKVPLLPSITVPGGSPSFVTVPEGSPGGNLPLIITNPPYGQRLQSPDLQGLYKTIGQKFKREFAGGEAWILSYSDENFDQIGLKPSLKTPLYNGSLECELRKYVLFDGRLSEHRAAGGTVKTDRERRQMSEGKHFKPRREEGSSDRNPKDFRGSRERRGAATDDNERDDRHRFNKYSKNDNYYGHRHDAPRGRGRFEDREDNDRRGDFRSRSDRDDFRGKGGRSDFRGKGDNRNRGDYRPKGNDRAARQEARRRFFGNDED
ncbi:MAG: RNA methyltransferase [Bacteroidaceae bacterium]|nr:RNA methyltransferase [Bacteroidaceae bacterium]